MAAGKYLSRSEGQELGVVVPPIGPNELTILAHNWKDLVGQGLTGKLLRVEVPGGGHLVAQVVGYRVVNSLGERASVVKDLANLASMDEQIIRLANRDTYLFLHSWPLAALRLEDSGWRRISPLPTVPPFSKAYLLSEDWFADGFPIRGMGLRVGHEERMFFSIGYHYGSSVRQRLRLEDFRMMNEAYNYVVAGLAGSGKSTLVKMLLGAYSANPKMSFLVVDTVGEFARAFEKAETDASPFSVPLATIYRRLKRPKALVFGVEKLRLDRWEVLEELLVEREVFSPIGVERKHQEAASVLRQSLQAKFKLDQLSSDEAALTLSEEVVKDSNFAKRVYSGKGGIERIQNAVQDSSNIALFKEKLKEVFSLFDRQKWSIEAIVSMLLGYGANDEASSKKRCNDDRNGKTVVLDLSSLSWGPVKYLLLRELFDTLYRKAMQLYRECGAGTANTLVIVEEAHRMVPPKEWVEEGSHQEKVRNSLRRALTETRKAGLGWLYISTRIANLDRSVFEESRVRIIGRGLSSGADADRIREAMGQEVLEAYQALPDPVDPLSDEREHVFMVSGPITVLSRSLPEFVRVYSNLEEYITVNFP